MLNRVAVRSVVSGFSSYFFLDESLIRIDCLRQQSHSRTKKQSTVYNNYTVDYFNY